MTWLYDIIWYFVFGILNVFLGSHGKAVTKMHILTKHKITNIFPRGKLA
jgi:hypothetical protein